MKIHNMLVSERPREKIINHGVEGLNNTELLAVVLQSGFKDESALVLGGRVISMLDHGLQDLTHTTYEELIAVKGIGPAKACQILSAIELGKRVAVEKRQMLGKINSPTTVVNFFQNQLRHINKEKFIVVFLNTKNIISSYEVISVGSLNASIVHPREVFNRAIKRSAAAILLVHNHPSGNPEPSKEDEAITSRLCEVGQLIGIRVLDHLIISDDKYFSFKEMDMI